MASGDLLAFPRDHDHSPAELRTRDPSERDAEGTSSFLARSFFSHWDHQTSRSAQAGTTLSSHCRSTLPSHCSVVTLSGSTSKGFSESSPSLAAGLQGHSTSSKGVGESFYVDPFMRPYARECLNKSSHPDVSQSCLLSGPEPSREEDTHGRLSPTDMGIWPAPGGARSSHGQLKADLSCLFPVSRPSHVAGRSHPRIPFATVGAPEESRGHPHDVEGPSTLSDPFPRESCLGSAADASISFSDYILQDRELGRGRYGVVRTCLHKRTGELLACKSVSKASLELDAQGSSLHSEIAALQALKGHPNVISLRHVAEDASSIHVIMELCPLGDLFDYITAAKRLKEDHARIMFRKIASSVSYCHSLSLIHRDIKPENVLLAQPIKPNALSTHESSQMTAGDSCEEEDEDEPSLPEPKLADFGLALPVYPGQPKICGLAGSTYYVAPEVIRGEPYSFPADVWSLGVLLYIMLSGYIPFWGSSDSLTFSSICRARPNLTSGPWATTSAAALDLVRWMLCADPDQRPTAAEILAHPWLDTGRERLSQTPESERGTGRGKVHEGMGGESESQSRERGGECAVGTHLESQRSHPGRKMPRLAAAPADTETTDTHLLALRTRDMQQQQQQQEEEEGGVQGQQADFSSPFLNPSVGRLVENHEMAAGLLCSPPPTGARVSGAVASHPAGSLFSSRDQARAPSPPPRPSSPSPPPPYPSPGIASPKEPVSLDLSLALPLTSPSLPRANEKPPVSNPCHASASPYSCIDGMETEICFYQSISQQQQHCSEFSALAPFGFSAQAQPCLSQGGSRNPLPPGSSPPAFPAAPLKHSRPELQMPPHAAPSASSLHQSASASALLQLAHQPASARRAPIQGSPLSSAHTARLSAVIGASTVHKNSARDGVVADTPFGARKRAWGQGPQADKSTAGGKAGGDCGVKGEGWPPVAVLLSRQLQQQKDRHKQEQQQRQVLQANGTYSAQGAGHRAEAFSKHPLSLFSAGPFSTTHHFRNQHQEGGKSLSGENETRGGGGVASPKDIRRALHRQRQGSSSNLQGLGSNGRSSSNGSNCCKRSRLSEEGEEGAGKGQAGRAGSSGASLSPLRGHAISPSPASGGADLYTGTTAVLAALSAARSSEAAQCLDFAAACPSGAAIPAPRAPLGSRSFSGRGLMRDSWISSSSTTTSFSHQKSREDSLPCSSNGNRPAPSSGPALSSGQSEIMGRLNIADYSPYKQALRRQGLQAQHASSSASSEVQTQLQQQQQQQQGRAQGGSWQGGSFGRWAQNVSATVAGGSHRHGSSTGAGSVHVAAAAPAVSSSSCASLHDYLKGVFELKDA